MTAEQQYIQVTELAHRKKFAQFFTPEPIADFMARWVLDGRDHVRVLEPAFGLGIFSRTLSRLAHHLEVDAYDTDKRIYDVATENLRASGCKGIDLRNENYITSSPWTAQYDAIICNPPYLKFHDYDNDRLVPVVNERLNTRLTKFTNLYTLFLLKSLGQLKDDGRCAYIIPSEFLNADYGVEVKRHLLTLDMQLHFIIVHFEENVFDGATTTACIVLCDNRPCNGSVRFSRIEKVAELESAMSACKTVRKDKMRPDVKWKNYYEGSNAVRYKYLIDFSNYAKVSRGIATGANNFFAFSKSKAIKNGVPRESLLRCVCHCTDISKSVFSREDFDRLSQEDKKVYLFKGVGNEHDPNVRNYIAQGEKNEVNKRFLCFKRNPWYALEKRKPSPIWVSVFNRSGLKFVRNEAQVCNLTTFHCLYMTNQFVDIDVFYAYLLTDLAYQIFLDNSRQYGNGLIKFEPNDLNKSKVVDLGMLTSDNVSEIKRLYAKFKIDEDRRYIRQIEEIFEQTFTDNDPLAAPPLAS